MVDGPVIALLLFPFRQTRSTGAILVQSFKKQKSGQRGYAGYTVLAGVMRDNMYYVQTKSITCFCTVLSRYILLWPRPRVVTNCTWGNGCATAALASA